MLKRPKYQVMAEVQADLQRNLYNPWISQDMQEYLKRVMMSMAMTIVDSIYDEKELELKAEQILLDNNRES